MKNVPGIDKRTLQALLDLLETPERKITREILFNRHPHEAQKLINDEWLVLTKNSTLIEVDGKITKVYWRDEAKSYQYFSQCVGWVPVQPKQLRQYEINLTACLFWLIDFFKISKDTRAEMLFENVFCYLGKTKIDSNFVNIYLCSRIDEESIRLKVTELMELESSRGLSLLVYGSSLYDELPAFRLPDFIKVIRFDKLLLKDSSICKLDQGFIKSVVYQNTQIPLFENQLSFSDDYRLVYWKGQKYKLTKTQAAVVETLDAEGVVHKDYLLAQANSNSKKLGAIMRNMKNGKMVAHPLWGTLITSEGNGYYKLSK